MSSQSAKFYLYSRDTWDAMLEVCAKAEQTIDLEQFIFCDDDIGRRFVEVLREKARQGVKVRVLCDAVGSWRLLTSSLPALMRRDKIEIRFLNVVSPWRINNFSSWFFRDHRKILVADEKIGIIGGTGFRDDMSDWRDTNIQVQNKTVNEMSSAFKEMWGQAVNRSLISRIRGTRTYARGFQFITNAPHFRRRFLYHAVIDALRDARDYAYLTTPYFIPDRRLIRTLATAVGRGVDVRIIVPKKERQIEPFVGNAVRSHYEAALRAGIKIFEYDKTFLHAKTAVIDDKWSTVGSFNLDSLSFLYNYEANIVSNDAKIAEALKNHFINDLAESKEIELGAWLKRAFSQKILEVLVKPFRRFL